MFAQQVLSALAVETEPVFSQSLLLRTLKRAPCLLRALILSVALFTSSLERNTSPSWQCLGSEQQELSVQPMSVAWLLLVSVSATVNDFCT